MSKPHEVFETEDLLQKKQNIQIARKSSVSKGACCGKLPFRTWIAAMVFFTTFINYTTRVNMSIAIVSMTGGKTKPEPYCNLVALNETLDSTFNSPSNHLELTTTLPTLLQANESILSTIAPTKKLPNYGPRYDWSEKLQGAILGSYFYGYVVSSLFGGFASERAGPFQVIFWTHIVIAICNSLSVWAAQLHYGALIACRIVMGICGGFVYPALQVLIAKWAPPAEKGKFVSCLIGNTLGTCITWPLVGAVTMAWGWDWGFHIVSIQNLIFSAVFFIIASDSPHKSRYVTEEELNSIVQAQAGTVSKKKLVAPYLKIFLSFPFWMLAILHFGNLWGLYVQLTTVPKFMAEVVGFDLKSSGGLSALPHIVRLFTGLFFGSLEDFLKSRKLMTTNGIRKFFTLFSHVLPGICLIFISVARCNAVANVTLLVLSMAINGAATITNLRNAQDLAPNFAGTIFGIISFIGGLTGFIVPGILGALGNNKTTYEWGIHFILGGSVYVVSGIIFILFGSVQLQSWNEVSDDKEDA